MSRSYYTQHEGTEIFCLDISNCPPEEFDATLAESSMEIRKHPYASLLTLAIGGEGTPITTNRGQLIEYLAMNAPHVKAAAVAGLPAMKREMFSSIMNLASREMKFFETELEAKNWLVSKK
jgi:hypothetical protein